LGVFFRLINTPCMRKPFLLLLALTICTFGCLAQPSKKPAKDLFNELDESLETILQNQVNEQQKTIDSIKASYSACRYKNTEYSVRLNAAKKAVELLQFLHRLEKEAAKDTNSNVVRNEGFTLPGMALEFLPGNDIDSVLKDYPHCKRLLQKNELQLYVEPVERITMASAPGIILPPMLSMGYTAATPYNELVEQARNWQSYIVELNTRCKTGYNIDQYFAEVEPAKIQQVETKESRKLSATDKQKLLIDLRKKFATLITNRCQK